MTKFIGALAHLAIAAAVTAQTPPNREPAAKQAQASGGEQLSGREVSELPLNKRDFSQLLLLAAGTMTDANGAANFTQQFAVNGQRGTATVFSMDGIDTTDPEMGGATFSNFNVDAIDEIRSSNGVMPAEVGHGAAGYTEIVSKSGSSRVHGSLFEFLRNAAFDARNFFDRRTELEPRRIPPFIRNEFGLTNGGPIFVPRVYDGRNRTFYFVQYQGFRQVLSSTQVVPVPTAEERKGINSTAVPGDALFVPVSPAIERILDRYPMPNDPQGPYGARTYATSARVRTVTDQFSARIDHRLSEKSRIFGRFSLNDVNGPLTNPGQVAIEPGFATHFLDRQRNAGVVWTYTASPRLTLETTAGFLRSTPSFPTLNRTEPALKFADGLYEGFNAPGGSLTTIIGNLFQLRQTVAWVRGRHSVKAGFEVRVNRDTTFFALSPNGEYTFGGGAAYSPVHIRSRSGLHDVRVGDPLPDALTGFLTGTPFSYSISTAPALFAQGDHMGDAALRREAWAGYIQDDWRVSSRLSLHYGFRYELSTPFREAAGKTAGVVFAGGSQEYLLNLDPPYKTDRNGWGPRLALDLRLDEKTVFRAGGSLMTILVNPFQCNFVTGGAPYVLRVYSTAGLGSPVPFSTSVRKMALPEIHTPLDERVYAAGRTTAVRPNTRMDVNRFVRELAALSPDGQVRPFAPYGAVRDYRNGYIGTWTAALERSIGDLKASASYVATAGVGLSTLWFPNGYTGADPAFAPYTQFDAAGRVSGGFGPEFIITNGSHSSYHALQAALGKNSLRHGTGFQASYTFGKSIDDTSSVLGGFLSGASGAVLQTSPQDPRNTRAEKAPSTFDIAHVFAFSVLQELPVARVPGFARLPREASSGWQLLGIGTLTSGSPFTVYSGLQQTGMGSNGAERPDRVGSPVFSTHRTVREDYFGQGERNRAYFSIPVGIAGGTGPNSGRFGSLGRNTFRGPAYHNFDLSLIKDTRLSRRGAAEPVVLQLRAECFNALNLVNFGLPVNIVLGPGFGLANKTAGTSRQIQFSLKLLY